MISSLHGALLAATPPTVTIECHGVGYEVWLPASSFGALPQAGEQVRLHTSMVVREDSHNLYGFLTPEERALFLTLIRISGVGAKSALSLLSELDASALAQAVTDGDARSLTRAQGIGRKNAERILVELRGSQLLVGAPLASPTLTKAVDALVALGYPAGAARSALANVDASGLEVADVVKKALAELSGGK